MPKMYHPTLPNTYDGIQVARSTFEVAWEPNGWRLTDDVVAPDPAVEELIAAMASGDEEE